MYGMTTLTAYQLCALLERIDTEQDASPTGEYALLAAIETLQEMYPNGSELINVPDHDDDKVIDITCVICGKTILVGEQRLSNPHTGSTIHEGCAPVPAGG